MIPSRIRTLLLFLLTVLLLWWWLGEELTQYSAKGSVQQPLAVVTDIGQLTQQQPVVDYLLLHHQLPNFYITKKRARELGWDASSGNLCQVAPGKAIGGDYFTNRERKLPIQTERKWREADLDYQCGHRGAKRILYSSDGLIYVTNDHYKSFSQVE